MAREDFTFNSSNLMGGGYDPESRELRITFKSGKTYKYDGVPEGTVESLRSDPSPGSFFYRNIRDVFPTTEE